MSFALAHRPVGEPRGGLTSKVSRLMGDHSMRKPSLQRTLSRSVTFAGVGLHSGEPCRAELKPAAAGQGVVFRRTDLSSESNEIPACPENVVGADHGTTLANSFGASVATVEHVMAALALTGVDNVVIEVTGPEIPILDGSSAAFVSAIAETGLQTLNAPRRALAVEEMQSIEDGDRAIHLEPFDGRCIEIEIDFGDCMIGRQTLSLDLNDPKDITRLSAARTFCRLHEVEALRSAGLIRGGALTNGLVVDGHKLLNEEPLRDPAEFALHKALDLIGDLYLLGAPLIGRIRAVKPGHALNTRAALALSSASEAAQQPARATA
ncbi:UDP-3-O-acyl-N-acetylglucosamine deacetylase [Hyphococcus sp.]|uniref:UDP-3-O-acyl-N-acetylglucosamine deacetylase n=1 Tax=Hyphococcus sp. TaxID=2038636 RepID=UPI003751CD7C